MRLDRVKEGSFNIVRAVFRNETNSATIPSTVQYKIDCETTGKEIRGWTQVTPALEVVIRVAPSDNILQSQSNRTEERVMTVMTDAGTDDQLTEIFRWVVVNLRGVK